MSLDVYLRMPTPVDDLPRQAIFIRENEETREISRAEWNDRFPGQEPAMAEINPGTNEVYSRNITHNLAKMAAVAGIYEALWRPDEIGITHAHQLVEPLTVGLARLRGDPEQFKVHNPPNGWGNYEGLISFVADYLEACKIYPNASVSVWR